MKILGKYINKKIIIATASVVIVLSILLIGYQATRAFPTLENSNIVSGPVSYTENDVKGISDLKEDEANEATEETENEDTQEVTNNSNNAQTNNTQNSDQKPTNNVATDQQCTPTLQAKFIRPYEQEYHYHLGDRMNQIIGSYDATCISESEVTYEWFIWGTSNSMPYTKISSASKPDVSSYEDGTYGIKFKVHAKGLSSELETWGWIQNIVQQPIPKPIFASIIVPIWGLIERKVLNTDTNIETFYFNTLNVFTNGDTAKWYIQSAHIPRTFIGEGKELNGVSVSLPHASTCQDSTFNIIVVVTNSEGTVKEDSKSEINTSNPCLN